jgi:hypothetical protein
MFAEMKPARWGVVVAAAVAATLSLGACGGGDATSTSAPERQSAVVASLEPDFAAFREPRAASDRVPDGLISPSAVKRLGLVVGASRLGYSGPSGRMYLIPAAGQVVCMFGTDRITAPCWPLDTVASGSAASTSMCSVGLPKGAMQMVGVVPDGVERVTLIGLDGSRRSVPTQGNVFVGLMRYEARSLPSQLAWTRDGRPHVQIAGILPKVAREACAQS